MDNLAQSRKYDELAARSARRATLIMGLSSLLMALAGALAVWAVLVIGGAR